MSKTLGDTEIGKTLDQGATIINNKILGIIRTTEKVNSKSDLLGNLVKKDKIDFTSEIVEKVYEFLPSEQKYIVDEVGNAWQLDPVGVVRTALESMQYQMDPAWYAWGTETPSAITKTKVAENINWKEAKDFFFSTKYDSEYNKQDDNQKLEYKKEKAKKILGIDNPDASVSEIRQRFNELDANQWYENFHKEILANIRKEISGYIDSEFTIAIATYITKDGIIRHKISTNGKTNGKSSKWNNIGEKIRNMFKSEDIDLVYSYDDDSNFAIPNLGLHSDNHAEVKILEDLVNNNEIDSKSIIYLSSDRRMCITCRMVEEQVNILFQSEHKDVSVEYYDGEGLLDTKFDYHFPQTWKDGVKFIKEYRKFFEVLKRKYPTFQINIDKELNRLWNLYKPDNSVERILTKK
ncbi:MAG: hypothetical protein HWN81_19675 [Candidatus Lokiarchaeota archaeon]|nr:hypothetical protein [Candidatus Lokiarchaeota archaeon]